MRYILHNAGYSLLYLNCSDVYGLDQFTELKSLNWYSGGWSQLSQLGTAATKYSWQLNMVHRQLHRMWNIHTVYTFLWVCSLIQFRLSGVISTRIWDVIYRNNMKWTNLPAIKKEIYLVFFKCGFVGIFCAKTLPLPHSVSVLCSDESICGGECRNDKTCNIFRAIPLLNWKRSKMYKLYVITIWNTPVCTPPGPALDRSARKQCSRWNFGIIMELC
jgi:hypothetical protein